MGISDWHWKAAGGQSHRTELLTCGIRYCLQVDGVIIELNYRIPSWYRTIAWICGEKINTWELESTTVAEID